MQSLKRAPPNMVSLYQIGVIDFNWVHSRLGYYFWDKRIKDYVALDLDVYYDLLLFD